MNGTRVAAVLSIQRTVMRESKVRDKGPSQSFDVLKQTETILGDDVNKHCSYFLCGFYGLSLVTQLS